MREEEEEFIGFRAAVGEETRETLTFSDVEAQEFSSCIWLSDAGRPTQVDGIVFKFVKETLRWTLTPVVRGC